MSEAATEGPTQPVSEQTGATAAGTAAQAVSTSPADAKPTVFRLPRTAYLIVLFLVFGTLPVAFTNDGLGHDSSGGIVGPQAVVGWQTLVLIAPLLVAVFIGRWATIVDGSGIRVRAAFGSQKVPWDEVRGIAVEDRTVYAVIDGGAMRLPCVHVNQLGQLARASAGRLPKIRDPKLKVPPSRRRR